MAKVPKKPIAKSDELTNDERELFLDAFFQGESVVEQKYQGVLASLPTKIVREDVHLGDDERELFLRAVNEGFKEAYAQHKPRHHEKARAAAAKKKRFVDAKIDLHGLSADEAIFHLNRFIDREQRRGSRTLLVVHGIGTGVLKKAVWSTVDTHPLVHDFQIASGKLGGQGAIVVRINRRILGKNSRRC